MCTSHKPLNLNQPNLEEKSLRPFNTVKLGEIGVTTTYRAILNCLLFFHFTEYKSSSNEDIGVKLCTNRAFKVFRLVKNSTTSKFQVSRYEHVDLSAYHWHFNKNIGQSVRYVFEIQRKSFPDDNVPLRRK